MEVLSPLGMLIWMIISLFTFTKGDRAAVTVNIYWNRSNIIFLPSNDNHILELALKDTLRFHCPHYDENWSNSPKEYYVIYRVPKVYYELCSLPPSLTDNELSAYNIQKVVTCNSPDRQKYFDTILQTFSALPGSHGGLTVQPGESYYFISLSSGTLEGLHNRNPIYSACQNNNMKLQLKVCCSSEQDTTSPPNRQYPTQPRRTTSSPRLITHTREIVTPPGHVRRHGGNVPLVAVTTDESKPLAMQQTEKVIINAEVTLDMESSSGTLSCALTLVLSVIHALFCIIQ